MLNKAVSDRFDRTAHLFRSPAASQGHLGAALRLKRIAWLGHCQAFPLTAIYAPPNTRMAREARSRASVTVPRSGPLNPLTPSVVTGAGGRVAESPRRAAEYLPVMSLRFMALEADY